MKKAKAHAKKIKDKGREEKAVAKKVTKEMDKKNHEIEEAQKRTNRMIEEV